MSLSALWDRIRDWVVLLLLLVAALVLIRAENPEVIRSLRASSLEVSGWVESRFAWAGAFVRALEENDRLRATNIELSNELARTRGANYENDQLRRMLDLRRELDAPFISAQIVEKDLTRQENFFVLDRGAADSVDVGMAVVDDEGVLGKVVSVSPNYARAMSLMNTQFSVPARVLPLGVEGIVQWDGQDRSRLVMYRVARTEPISVGQEVVTSGFSGVFPANYPIGMVDSFAVQQGRNELRIWINPTTTIYNAGHAFILRDKRDVEIDSLAGLPLR
jgi:rod shape-determining protein MreC